jgi:hypothetical protein
LIVGGRALTAVYAMHDPDGDDEQLSPDQPELVADGDRQVGWNDSEEEDTR